MAKKNQNGWFIAIFRFLRQKFDLVCGSDNLKSVSCILFKFVMHFTNKQLSVPLASAMTKQVRGDNEPSAIK